MELVNAKARPSEATYELECLPGAWVKLRRFNHGERIDRMGKVLTIGYNQDDETGQATINHRAARLHDFANAILDHNLGDGTGKKYNFHQPDDVFAIDPSVGDEIDDLIQTHQEVIPDAEIPKSEENSSDTTSTPSSPEMESLPA
jgi:hypothetical protein